MDNRDRERALWTTVFEASHPTRQPLDAHAHAGVTRHQRSAGRPQDRRDLREPQPFRVLQRRDPVVVADRGIRTGIEQDPHDLLVPRSPVAEDHGLEQRGPAQAG